jgi:hypothetical protein
MDMAARRLGRCWASATVSTSKGRRICAASLTWNSLDGCPMVPSPRRAVPAGEGAMREELALLAAAV